MKNSVARIINPKLPINYEAARQALAACVLIDECKEWKDRAAAIASYAEQKRDRGLLDKAIRIRARATRRLGELLEIRRPEGVRLADLGITSSERSQARAVASVPSKKFESHVERSPPTPISKLAQMGRGPIDYDTSAPIWVTAERLRKHVREFPIEALRQNIADCTPEQKAALKKAFTPVSEWFDELAHAIDL